jgi:cell wall-associated NlpC family hydrolase
MKKYFQSVIEDAKRHALQEYPKESCGIVVDGKYIPCTNISNNPTVAFQIKPDDYYLYLEDRIECVIHSHDNYAHASKQDMIDQEKLGVPFGIINIHNGAVEDVFFWGDTLPIQDYVGRQFFHGVYDCYGLVRDYFRREYKITPPMYPRDYGWWLQGENVIEEGIMACGFKVIETNDVRVLKPGDGILAKVNSDIVNHCGVYIGDGLLLHHLCLRKNRLSEHLPINSMDKKQIYYIVRHERLL